MSTTTAWYAIGTRVYARRNTEAHGRDPIVAAAASAAIARHLVDAHNHALTGPVATRIVPSARAGV